MEKLFHTSPARGKHTLERRCIALQVISIMISEYASIPIELWDLCKSTDTQTDARGVYIETHTPMDILHSILTQNRFKVTRIRTDSTFNEHIHIPTCTKIIHLGENFNQNLDFPDGIEEIFFGWDYNREHVRLPRSLRKVSFGWNFRFNEPLPENLKEASFSAPCDVELPEGLCKLTWNSNSAVRIPSTVEHLVLGPGFNCLVELPEGVRRLHVGQAFDRPITLPRSLKHLTWRGKESTRLPCNLTSLEWLCKHTVDLPVGIESAVYGDDFDHPVALPHTLKYLSFGKSFNFHVRLPKMLKTVHFGADFDQNLDNIPENLEELIFGDRFRRPVDLPEGGSLRTIVFGKGFNSEITSFPKGVKKVVFGEKFDQKLESLPESITHMEFGSAFSHSIDLPAHIQHVTWNCTVPIPLHTGLKDLKSLTLGDDFYNLVDIPESVEELTLGSRYHHPIVFPTRLRKLTWNCNCKVDLPGGGFLKEIIFGPTFNMQVTLPEGLTQVTFGYNFCKRVVLPGTLRHVTFSKNYRMAVELPPLCRRLYPLH